MAPAELEAARARLLERAPGGWEERETAVGIELAVYGDEAAADALAILGPVESAEVEPGWDERWRAFHRPVRIGPLWVGPPWAEPERGALAVVIDPGRAFGTGAHATTRLCLELLIDHPRGSLADLGCGSGVLAIAAARLGFGPVEAVDADPAAIEATRANAQANGVDVVARLLDLRSARPPVADVAVANLERGLVEALAPRVGSPALIASGYLDVDVPVLPGWRRARRLTADGWAAERYERARDRG